ncbi:hypothetical protein D3C77_395460 [compost metagenome]
MIFFLDRFWQAICLQRLQKTLYIRIKGNQERHVLQIFHVGFQRLIHFADQLQRIIRDLAVQYPIHSPVDQKSETDGGKDADEQKMNDQFITDR